MYLFRGKEPIAAAPLCFLSWRRGKMLGGSSGINGLAWGRASKPEYDSWSVLSGDGTWSWKGLLPYMQKAENFSAVPTNPYPGISGGQKARVSHDIPQEDGYNGPIHVSSCASVEWGELMSCAGIVQQCLLSSRFCGRGNTQWSGSQN